MSNKNTICQTMNIISLVVCIFLGLCSGIAQTNMTKIKDGTVLETTAEPSRGAILELESATKGFLVPRLSTIQRNAISSLNRSDGLMIYNKDSGCFNYWSQIQDSWLSLCGTPEPAEFEILNNQCEELAAHGSLKQGEYLNGSNYLTIPVNVLKAGTYKMDAFTDNGYYFTAEGRFPSVGNYLVSLTGLGVPSRGYENGDLGDQLVIELNSNSSTCTNRYVFVEKAEVNYSIDCTKVQIEGIYNAGKELTRNEKMILEVNVQEMGYWNITTNVVNGYYFKGNGIFTATGVQRIELIGAGTPEAEASNVFSISTNSATPSTCSSNAVSVKGISYLVDCNGITVNGEYKQGVSLNEEHSVNVSVDVKSIGRTEIRTEESSGDGMYFSSGPIVFTEIGVQNVILKGKGTPSSSGVKTFNIKASHGLNRTEDVCSFEVNVVAQPVRYAVECGMLEVRGDYRPQIPMNTNNVLVVKVNVEQLGAYEMVTNQENGVLFKASGTFTTTGLQEVMLKAEGTPLASGWFEYKIQGTEAEDEMCSIGFPYTYRTMNVLGLGSGGYQPASASNKETVRAVLLAQDNFGTNGTVGSRGFTIVNGGDRLYGVNLKNLINEKKIDIIIIGYNYQPDEESVSVLRDFVNEKKGVLIHAQERDEAGVKKMIEALSQSSNVSLSTSGATIVNSIVDIDEPILNGPFENVKGKNVGADLNNSLYVTGFSDDYISLVHQEGNASRSWLLKHKTLGYFFIGDAGWLAGDISQRIGNRWPATINGRGVPVKKIHSGGKEIYNSALYANIMAWAIKYVTENVEEDFQLD